MEELHSLQEEMWYFAPSQSAVSIGMLMLFLKKEVDFLVIQYVMKLTFRQ